MQNWDGVDEFVAVVEQRSFSAAAGKLRVSRSHISKKVKELEHRLGVELLHRTTRSVNLTRLGAEFFPKCQRLLADMDEAQALLIDEAASPHGTIRLTVAGAFGEQMLAPALADFTNKYSDITVLVEFTNRLVNLSEEQFDLAIRSGLQREITRKNEMSERLYSYNLMTVASPHYLSGKESVEKIADLHKHNCLIGSLPHWRFQYQGQLQNTVVHGRWRSNNGHALVEAAMKGVGIIQVPDFYVQEPLSRGALVPLLSDCSVAGLGYFAVVPAAHPPRRVAVLIDHLRENLMAA